MIKITTRQMRGKLERAGSGRLRAAFVSSMVIAATIGSGYGVLAAEPKSKAGIDAPKPITIAGRWSGFHYGARLTPDESCGGKPCTLTFDVVACDGGWCGIVVRDDKPCGAIALHLHETDKRNRHGIFEGKLELAKGSAPFVVQASYFEKDGSKTPTLNFIGDTGSELLLMRRSYPLQAELARSGDAQCTLEKATS